VAIDEISECKTPVLIYLEYVWIGEIKVVRTGLEQLCDCRRQSAGQSVSQLSQSVSQSVSRKTMVTI